MYNNYYSEEDHEKTIFIPIAACKELFLEQTIKSALSLASNPNRLFFGVFNNILDPENVVYFDSKTQFTVKTKKTLSLLSNPFFTKNEQIVYAELVTAVPMGVGYGRLNASLLSQRNCDYFFQIDAHTVFSKDWDKIIIENYNRILNETNNNKVILTALPGHPWTYDPKNPEVIYTQSKQLNDELGIEIINPYNNDYNYIEAHNGTVETRFDGWQGTVFSEENVGMPISFGGNGFTGEYYQESNAIHASFVFGKYESIREVMHDPQDIFNGDQTNYTLRILSRSYKIFSVKRPFLLTLDKYVKDKNGEVSLLDEENNWRAFSGYSPSAPSEYHNTLQKNSKKRYKEIFSGEYLGYWGAENIDTLKEAKKKMGFPEL